MAAARAPADSLRQTVTQLTGVAGLLVPLLLSDPAFAATPDGEHLTKVCFAAVWIVHRMHTAIVNSRTQDDCMQGTLVSLIHPAIMDFLFLSTLWTGYLGWQWRRTRTIPEELKQLKKELPEKDAEGNRPVSKVDGRIAALEEVSLADTHLLQASMQRSLASTAVLLQQRKLMSKKEYKGRHHNWGGLIMGLGTATAVAGPVNTYLRAGMKSCMAFCSC